MSVVAVKVFVVEPIWNSVVSSTSSGKSTAVTPLARRCSSPSKRIPTATPGTENRFMALVTIGPSRDETLGMDASVRSARTLGSVGACLGLMMLWSIRSRKRFGLVRSRGMGAERSARRRSTRTSPFGSSKREAHDASGFYSRFSPPEVSSDVAVHPDKAIDKLIVGTSTAMHEVPDASVGLVVTSPPYFAGKEYEEELGHEGIPATYLEYLDLLRAVFKECVRTLEPGGRMAVNVANLGRRPYRSLSADVIGILQDDLRLLLRGEIVWQKQRGSSGSCAWGSFQQPKNPVLRDLTERVIIASKGRFDRCTPRARPR